MEQDIINDYQQRADVALEQANKYEKLANKYSLQRLAVFGFLIFSVYLSVVQDEILIFAFCLLGSVFWFAWLVRQQSKFEQLKRYYTDLKKVNENEIANILHRTNIYHDGAQFNNDKHFYTSDLDIYDSRSLFHLINRSSAAPGNYKLAKWLDAPADKQTILQRQQAVKEIAGKNDWKLNFQTLLLFGLKQPADHIKNLVTYLKTTVEIKDEKFLTIYSQAAPYIMLTLIVASIFYAPARYVTVLVAFGNNRLVSSRGKLVERADLIAGKIGASLALYAFAFEAIQNESWEAPYNQVLAGRIKRTGGDSVSSQIRQLSKLIGKLNSRLNLFVSFILNVFFIWDIRHIIAIENWKRRNHESLEVAFDVIAEFEAIMGLAGLAINNPGYTYPEIVDEEAYTIIAQEIAHPLIDEFKRVKNDYELNDTFKVDIITGSNMAGKSTFLRTIGINTVLALCGAPVCSKNMRVSVITIISYMRIKDSLNESTSTFKAELDRLQMLLAAVQTEPKVFFLIDEMLRGTNSVDKYRGSKAVIEQLIAKKGVGMVATHDLQIARLEDTYPDYVRNYYFDIQVKNGEMLFDYKIKHGECKTFNASLLLKQIGIDVGEEESRD